jgi:hypothetical protein
MYVIFGEGANNDKFTVYAEFMGESVPQGSFSKARDAERFVHYLNGGNNDYFAPFDDAPADGEEGRAE